MSVAANRPERPRRALLALGLAAGAAWTFETGAVNDPGVGQAAFASASVP